MPPANQQTHTPSGVWCLLVSGGLFFWPFFHALANTDVFMQVDVVDMHVLVFLCPIYLFN